MSIKSPPIPHEFQLTYEERVAMLEKWKYFGQSIAKGWFLYSPIVPLEEYQAAVMEGFWEAGIRFDTRRDLQFSTYAKFWAVKCCRDLMIQSKGYKRRDWYTHGKFIFTASFEFDVAQKEPKEPTHLIDIWAIAQNALDAKRLIVLQLRFQENKTLDEIAEQLSLSRERIRQLLATAIEKLKSRLKHESKVARRMV